MKKFYINIILPAILSILLFILTIFYVIIPRFQQNIMDDKRETIKELTNVAWSILSKFENDEKNGLISREEAQKTAVLRIQYLRYGEENKDYFWITDMTPTMIIHPYRLDLTGKDLSNLTDPHGKRLFVEFVETVKKTEHGYVEYMWQWKDDSLLIVPKLSYVRIFKPWNWVIGTGIYVEDVKKEIATLTKKMVWISVAITILIALLLFYILKQSFNIEHKRIAAENDLHESKEKYRTLVEAATDGLLMLHDGKISFSNAAISKMTGIQSSELSNLPLFEIISKNNNKDILDIFSKSTIKEGQFELNLIQKNGGLVNTLVVSSITRFYGNTVNILIIKNISIDKSLNPPDLDYQKLIGLLNIGFFKVRMDLKGKFLFANETAIRILGFESFRELADTSILQLLAATEDKKQLIGNLVEKGFIKGKVLKIYKKEGSYSIVSVSLVVTNNENANDLICEGTIEDITTQEKEAAQTNNLIAELKSTTFLIEQSVTDYIIPFNSVDADSSISSSIEVMRKRNTDHLLVSKNGKDFIGIVTNSDIQKRVLALKLSLENPLYLIMSSPIIYINDCTTVGDAIIQCEEKRLSHLVVRDNAQNILGVFSTGEIFRNVTGSLLFFIHKVNKSDSNSELKQCYKSLQLLLKPLIKSDISANYITNLTSSFSDSVITRVIELSIKEIGVPPVSFSFICLGSEGRKEETLFTDQDNAIIYEDVSVDNESIVGEYFIRLGELVSNSLNQIGYSFCKGNIMAKNPQWNKPISTWKKYFTNWIVSPEPQNLLDATIFFDFRNVYGNPEFANELRKTINSLIPHQAVFLYHLASNTFNAKIQQITSSSNQSDKEGDSIDLKSSINHIIQFARTYSLQNSISSANSLDRLHALEQRQIITKSMADEMMYSYNFLMKLRFKNQISLLEKNLPLSNFLNTKSLNDIEVSILKNILSKIPEWNKKIRIDFRLNI